MLKNKYIFLKYFCFCFVGSGTSGTTLVGYYWFKSVLSKGWISCLRSQPSESYLGLRNSPFVPSLLQNCLRGIPPPRTLSSLVSLSPVIQAGEVVLRGEVRLGIDGGRRRVDGPRLSVLGALGTSLNC